MPRARRDGPLPRVVLCAALTLDGKLDPAGPQALLEKWRGRDDLPASHPWADWYGDPATLFLADDWTAAALRAGVANERILPAPGQWRSGAEAEDVLRGMLRQRSPSAESGVRRVVCLGGPGLFRALLDAGVVREILLSVRPRIDGRRDAATLSGPPGAEFFPASVACRLLKVEMREGGCSLHYRVGGR